MNTQHASRWFWPTLVLPTVVLSLCLSNRSVETVSATVDDASVPIPAPTVGRTRRHHRVSLFQTPRNELDVRALNGLRVVTFDAPSGKVYLYLPDDMRAGDTISGTVRTEPKGQTPEERKKNLETLNGYTITLWPNPAPKKPGDGIVKLPVKEPTFTFPLTPGTYDVTPGTINPVFGFPGFRAALGPPIVVDTSGNFGAADAFPGIGSVVSGILPGAVSATTGIEAPIPTAPVIPPLGQQGRPLEIPGSFDGSLGNTILRFGPVGSTVQDFEKNTQNVSGGFGLIKPLAESPRKIVVECPSNVVGRIQVFVLEGDKKTTGTVRNVGVNLSAPKTSLLKGERTTLTVEVSGLEGLKKPAPLQLDAAGVILMDGGNFQNLRINPSEVNQQGRYTTTRAITGQQAGAFTVVATVIVDRFDVCMADDSKPHSGILWNTFTGDYIFNNPGPPPRPVGQPPSGGTVTPGGTPPASPGGTSLTGTGTLARKGCVIVLTHNAPDRRVFARLDACTKTGEATVQTKSPQTNTTITDKNITDNTCGSK